MGLPNPKNPKLRKRRLCHSVPLCATVCHSVQTGSPSDFEKVTSSSKWVGEPDYTVCHSVPASHATKWWRGAAKQADIQNRIFETFRICPTEFCLNRISSRICKTKIGSNQDSLLSQRKHVGGENTKQTNIQEYSKPLEILVQTRTYRERRKKPNINLS